MNRHAAAELRAYLEVFARARLAPPRITSTDRTPAQNARVGGVENSKHMYGLAADLVPAPTWAFRVSFQQLGENARAWLPHVEVIVERDHVHLEWPWSYYYS